MKVIGAGLGRTCTTSLAKALTLLGLKTLHWAPERLYDVLCQANRKPNWRRYDDVDAVTDEPAAFFWQELLGAYPEAKCILTVRDEWRWFRSIKWLYEDHIPVAFSRAKAMLRPRLHKIARCTRLFGYGSLDVNELLWRKRFREHNQLVRLTVPRERLLIMDIEAGDGWESLCGFLGVPVPDKPFPHENKSKKP